MSLALEHKAAALVFVHNHPSGDPAPSPEDHRLTRELVWAARLLQIQVLDHIIIGGHTYFSFADQGLVRQYGEEYDRRLRSPVPA
jgi:DNA repair protein RadC